MQRIDRLIFVTYRPIIQASYLWYEEFALSFEEATPSLLPERKNRILMILK